MKTSTLGLHYRNSQEGYTGLQNILGMARFMLQGTLLVDEKRCGRAKKTVDAKRGVWFNGGSVMGSGQGQRPVFFPSVRPA